VFWDFAPHQGRSEQTACEDMETKFFGRQGENVSGYNTGSAGTLEGALTRPSLFKKKLRFGPNVTGPRPQAIKGTN